MYYRIYTVSYLRLVGTMLLNTLSRTSRAATYSVIREGPSTIRGSATRRPEGPTMQHESTSLDTFTLYRLVSVSSEGTKMVFTGERGLHDVDHSL